MVGMGGGDWMAGRDDIWGVGATCFPQDGFCLKQEWLSNSANMSQ
jgi:hypothetical protein